MLVVLNYVCGISNQAR